jgi:hypothetical protein
VGVMCERPVFSRNGETIGQKCDTELKALVPSSVHDDFVAVATMHRKSKGEYLREVIMAHLYGSLESMRMKINGVASAGEGRE